MRIALLCCNPQVVFGDGRDCPVRLRGLGRALHAAGHEVVAIAAGVPPGHETHAQPVLRPLRMPVTVREIDWHLSRIGPEVVIERWSPGSLEGARAAAEAGIPHLYDFEQAPPADHDDALRASFAFSQGAVSACPALAVRLQSLGGPRFAVQVLGNAAEPAFLGALPDSAIAGVARVLRLDPGTFHVGFFGALTERSGVMTLISALAALARERPVRLLALGDGPVRNEALRLSYETGMPLTLIGHVAHREVPAYLALCDVVVVPAGSGTDRSPLSLLEALALSRAVIVPAREGTPLAIEPGENGVVVPPYDAAALERALRELANDAAARTRMGARGRAAVEGKHTWNERAGSLVSFARTLAARTQQQCG